MNVRYPSTVGHNARAFHHICCLYFKPEYRVLDATYGMDGFWKLAKDLWLRPIQPRPGVHIVGDPKLTLLALESPSLFIEVREVAIA